MKNRLKSRTTIRALGAVWIVIGLALMANDNAVAIPFVGLGLLFWSRASATGEQWADQNPALAHWLLIGLSALAVLGALALLVLRNP
jgi:hypothetical protein